MSEVTVYTTNTCPYCVAAKSLLAGKGIKPIEINVAGSNEKMLEMMSRSVPQIFINDLHVGGFDDLAALERKGELHALLAG
jgi:glutaredoxin 3